MYYIILYPIFVSYFCILFVYIILYPIFVSYFCILFVYLICVSYFCILFCIHISIKKRNILDTANATFTGSRHASTGTLLGH